MLKTHTPHALSRLILPGTRTDTSAYRLPHSCKCLSGGYDGLYASQDTISVRWLLLNVKYGEYLELQLPHRNVFVKGRLNQMLGDLRHSGTLPSAMRGGILCDMLIWGRLLFNRPSVIGSNINHQAKRG